MPDATPRGRDEIDRGAATGRGGALAPGRPASVFEKIWNAHLVGRLPDGRDLVFVDRHVLQETTSARAFDGLRRRGRTVPHPELTIATEDHIVSTQPGRNAETNPDGRELVTLMRANAAAYGIRHFAVDDPRQGIVHVIAPELGIALPGCVLACGDSHTSTVGGLGAIGIGVGTSDVEHILATQTLALVRPEQIRIRFEGRLGPGVTAKDMILRTAGAFGIAVGRGCAIEYMGSAVRALPVEARLTLCNMSVEIGARLGLIAPDEQTIDYVHGRPFAPRGSDLERAADNWRRLPTDAGAVFKQDLAIDCDELAPQVTWGTTPEDVLGVDGRVPDPASFATAMRRDLAARALTLHGAGAGPAPGRPPDRRRFHRLLHQCAAERPRSGRRGGCRQAGGAECEGARRAGIEPGQGGGRKPRPAPHLSRRRLRVAGGGLLDVRQHQRGRGAGRSALHLHVQSKLRQPAGPRQPHPSGEPGDGGSGRPCRPHHRRTKGLRGVTASSFGVIEGVMAVMPESNINTDAIIPSVWLRRASTDYGRALFSNERYDEQGRERPEFVLNKPPFRQAKILLGGENFGCGSSREAAVWAIKEFGIGCVLALSFANIFYENAFRNGLLPGIVDATVFAALGAAAESASQSPVFAVDLATRTVRAPDGATFPFHVPDAQARTLQRGEDAIDLTLQQAGAIESFLKGARDEFPWLYPAAAGG